MLTKQTLKKMLLDLLSLNEIGCTYDFKDRFHVSLKSLEVLGFVKAIRTRIPACGDHCEKFEDCKWISIYKKRKSKSKFRFTKNGLSLANFLLSDLSDDVLVDAILEQISNTAIVEVIQSLLNNQLAISPESLVTALLDRTNIKIADIRFTTKDILDLLESLQEIKIDEGVIVKC